MFVFSSGTATTVTKEELACICACLALILEDKNFKVTNITKQENKWKKFSRQMMFDQKQMFFKWR